MIKKVAVKTRNSLECAGPAALWPVTNYRLFQRDMSSVKNAASDQSGDRRGSRRGSRAGVLTSPHCKELGPVLFVAE
jgi:hypothetical protein